MRRAWLPLGRCAMPYLPSAWPHGRHRHRPRSCNALVSSYCCYTPLYARAVRMEHRQARADGKRVREEQQVQRQAEGQVSSTGQGDGSVQCVAGTVSRGWQEASNAPKPPTSSKCSAEQDGCPTTLHVRTERYGSPLVRLVTADGRLAQNGCVALLEAGALKCPRRSSTR